jgi:hypothetical protein
MLAHAAAVILGGVRKEDILAFAQRDWDAIAEHKRRYWAERPMTDDERLHIADELRRYARTLHPDWPTPEERESDLAMHMRVSEALRRVPPRHG